MFDLSSPKGAGILPTRAGSGPKSAKLGPVSTDLKPHIGEVWPNIAQLWPDVEQQRPTCCLTLKGPKRATAYYSLGPIWPHLGKPGPKFGQTCRTSLLLANDCGKWDAMVLSYAARVVARRCVLTSHRPGWNALKQIRPILLLLITQNQATAASPGLRYPLACTRRSPWPSSPGAR